MLKQNPLEKVTAILVLATSLLHWPSIAWGPEITWPSWKPPSWVIDALHCRLLKALLPSLWSSFKHFCMATHCLLFYLLLLPYWILDFPAHNSKKELYFRVERGPHMWPIISISTCLPLWNSYCLLIGSCLAGGVLNSCHIRMGSLSYSKLQFGALIKRPLLFFGFSSPPSLSLSIPWANNSAQQGHYRLWIESWEC